MVLGLAVTGLFILFSQYYYRIKSQQAPLAQTSDIKTMVYRTIEGLDYLFYDLRLVARGEQKSEAPVILLTIDDASIEQIGRWPWSREKIAKVIERMLEHGTKVVGFDIVFSEPQENPLSPLLEGQFNFSENPDLKYVVHPDQSLIDLIEAHPASLVLGAFPEQGFAGLSEPYQDYCRNEAFLHYNASQFVKFENVSFAVIDNADPYEELDFSPLFAPIFEYLEGDFLERHYSEHFDKPLTELTPFELRRLASLQNQHLMGYCSRWLTDTDEFRATSDSYFTQVDHPKLSKLPPKDRVAYFKKTVLTYPIHQYDSWTINTPEMHESSLFTGSFNAYQDNDGKIRRQALFYRTGQRLGLSFVPSLALQTYLAAHPSYQAQVEIDVDEDNTSQKKITSMKIMDIENDRLIQQLPVDGKGQLLINYAGGRDMYPYVPAKELLHDRPDMTITEKVWHDEANRYVYIEKKVNKQAFLKDKVALFGATATAVYDLRVTPFDKNFPGPEIHVTALANLFDQQYLHAPREESRAMPMAIGVLGLITTVVLSLLGPLMGLIFVSTVFGATFYFDHWLLGQGYIITTVLPVLLLILLFLTITLVKYFTEERKKRELKSTFSKYVSPAIVDEILASPENLELGGRKQNVSIFFSDVRGFTTISEKLDPQKLSQLLNRYLTPMTEIVFKNKGTLDKYMGDAVMAFFGAPIAFENHPKFACKAALDSIEELKRLQDEFAKENLPLIDIGIGINTAEVSVGNMGSEIVRNYTVMGDGVNLASRLEGINKEYGTRIVISQYTYEHVKDEFLCRELDRVKVKGKKDPVVIYELIGLLKDKDKLPDVALFNEALQSYYAQNFEAAQNALLKHLEKWPQDPVAILYAERITYYQTNPPPANWDGVHEMKTK